MDFIYTLLGIIAILYILRFMQQLFKPGLEEKKAQAEHLKELQAQAASKGRSLTLEDILRELQQPQKSHLPALRAKAATQPASMQPSTLLTQNESADRIKAAMRADNEYAIAKRDLSSIESRLTSAEAGPGVEATARKVEYDAAYDEESMPSLETLLLQRNKPINYDQMLASTEGLYPMPKSGKHIAAISKGRAPLAEHKTAGQRPAKKRMNRAELLQALRTRELLNPPPGLR